MLLDLLVGLLLVSAAIYLWLGWLNYRRFGDENPHDWTYRLGYVAFYLSVLLGIAVLVVAVAT